MIFLLFNKNKFTEWSKGWEGKADAPRSRKVQKAHRTRRPPDAIGNLQNATTKIGCLRSEKVNGIHLSFIFLFKKTLIIY